MEIDISRAAVCDFRGTPLLTLGYITINLKPIPDSFWESEVWQTCKKLVSGIRFESTQLALVTTAVFLSLALRTERTGGFLRYGASAG